MYFYRGQLLLTGFQRTTMWYYFKLRLKTTVRFGKDIGLPIWISFILFSLIFFSLYSLSQKHPTYAPYGIIYIGWVTIYSNSSTQHVNFLKTIFSYKNFITVRFLELTILLSPLLIISIFSYSWWTLLLLLLLILISTFSKGLNLSYKSIPTPFSKKPFEFIIYFRKAWLLFVLLYLVAGIGLYVSNPNLCMFILAITYLTSLQSYNEMEQENILWNYSMKPRKFLVHKIKRGILQISQLALPLLLVISFFFPENLLWHLAIWGLSCLSLILIILVKYALYPRPIGIMEFFLIAFSTFIPFFIFLLYFYYYRKANANLKRYGL